MNNLQRHQRPATYPELAILAFLQAIGPADEIRIDTFHLRTFDAPASPALGRLADREWVRVDGERYTPTAEGLQQLPAGPFVNDELAAILFRVAIFAQEHFAHAIPPDRLMIIADYYAWSRDVVLQQGAHRPAATVVAKAGNVAEEKGDDPQAIRYYAAALGLLQELKDGDAQEEQFLLAMTLVKSEYRLGHYDRAEELIDQLLERHHEVEKRAVLFEQKIIINNRLARYRKALLILREGLVELGLVMPLEENAQQQEVSRLEAQVRSAATGTENEAHDREILKLLFTGGMSLHHSSDLLMKWGALQIILRSGAGDDLAEKAIGYVVYGRVKVMEGDLAEGYHFGRRGFDFNRSIDDLTHRCRVYGVFAFFILPWKERFEAGIALLGEAFAAGVMSGDSIGCYVVKTHEMNLHLLAGHPLQQVLDVKAGEADPQGELTYYITHYQHSLIAFLTEQKTVFTIPVLPPSWLAATNTVQEEKFYRYYVWSRYYFLFGYYEAASEAAAVAHANRKLQQASPLVPANLFVWFLAVTQYWHNYTDTRKDALAGELDSIAGSIEEYSASCPENYASCAALVRAELARIRGSEDPAEHYREATRTAGNNLWYKAIATECAMRYYLGKGDVVTGMSLHRSAVELYLQWGAPAKARQLTQQYRPLLGTKDQSIEVDIELVQHELSGDLDPASLIKKLMSLCLRISGSTRIVIDAVENGNARSRLGEYSLLPPKISGRKTPSGLDALMAKADPSRKTVENVVGPGEAIGGHGASRLVLPINIRDHLSLVVGLENSFASEWYDDEKVRLVRITANQGAIHIENARIHDVTVRLNNEIRLEMEEKERLAIEIKRQQDLHLKELDRTQNAERRRIAGDLHDRVGSLLSGAKLQLTSLSDDIMRQLPGKTQRFEGALRTLDEAVQELRRIVYDMMPVSLSRFGLKLTMETFLETIAAAGQISVESQILGLDERLEPEIETEVYRICQELVQNVLKHANATAMRVQIIRHDDAVNVTVEDNGSGMDQALMNAGIGFTTIRSKMRLWKGNLAIESRPGEGTLILVDIPLRHPHG